MRPNEVIDLKKSPPICISDFRTVGFTPPRKVTKVHVSKLYPTLHTANCAQNFNPMELVVTMSINVFVHDPSAKGKHFLRDFL